MPTWVTFSALSQSRHSLKVPRGRRPRAHLLAQRLARLAYEQASHDRLLVDIQPTATLDESSHDHLHIIRRRTRRRRYDEDTAIRAARFRARQRVVPQCSAGRTAYRGRKPPQVWSALTRSQTTAGLVSLDAFARSKDATPSPPRSSHFHPWWCTPPVLLGCLETPRKLLEIAARLRRQP